MVEAATVAQTAEAVAEVATPVVATGTLDKKKVALVAGGVIVVSVGTYFCIKAIKKRKAKKVVIESVKEPVVDPTLDDVAE